MSETNVTQSNLTFESLLNSTKTDMSKWINNLINNTPPLEGQDRTSTAGGITQQTEGVSMTIPNQTTSKPTDNQFLAGLQSLVTQVIRQSPLGQKVEEEAIKVVKKQAAYETGAALGNFISHPLFIISCIVLGLWLIGRRL